MNRPGARYEAPPPYTIAPLCKRRHAKERAKGLRFGLFVRRFGRQSARLVAPFRYEVEAFRHAWSLVDREKREPEPVVIDEAIERRLKENREAAGARCG